MLRERKALVAQNVETAVTGVGLGLFALAFGFVLAQD